MRLGIFGYYVDFIGAVIGGSVLFILGMLSSAWVAKAEWLMCFLIGAVLWTLAEYAIHRWLYHSVSYFIVLHDEHHKSPTEYIGAPPLIGLLFIFGVIFLPVAAFSVMAAGGLTAGLLAGYATYQLVHHADHFWRPKPAGYFYRARLRHAVHHYHNELGNFGVTTPLWDLALGSAVDARRTPSKLAARHEAG